MATRASLLQFRTNGSPVHAPAFRRRRLLNWLPLGLGYASLVFMRYNLNAAQSALSADKLMTLDDFGKIFAVGAWVYLAGFLYFGRKTDVHGGRWGMITGMTGATASTLLMALAVKGVIAWHWNVSLFWMILILYSINMFFQSLGAMSIVTTKMPWFHVRERGTFSTIFGMMISTGIYFAFDWGYALVSATRTQINLQKMDATARFFSGLLGSGGHEVNESWWIFLFPALFAIVWLAVIILTLRNKPSDAGFADFETGDEHIAETPLTMGQMLREVFLNPKHRTILIICLIEFCSGGVRNGVMQLYPKFAETIGFKHEFWISQNWGLSLLIAGIIGANATGWVSDKVFRSRRGPMALFLYGAVIVCAVLMFWELPHHYGKYGASLIMGIATLVACAAIIGVHGILSGTAAADFTGVKNTAKAVGIVDGAVYAGTGVQSWLTGLFLASGPEATNPKSWAAWPIIIGLFALGGIFLSGSIYHAFPKSKRAPH